MFISVIIPVYNAEDYLRRCLESVLSQTYKDFELILVDDGSKDKSGAMCDSFASQDCRVRVIHQQNAGAGAARNVGISLAKGDYLVFIDSDDIIRQGYFEALIKHNEDVVFINVDNIDEKGRIVKREYMSDSKHLSKDDILRSQMTGKLPWGGVRKCVKLRLINDNKISYSNHKIGEEAIYSYQVIRNAKSIGFIDKSVYCCMLHDNSLSRTKVDDPWGDVAITLREIVRNQGDYPMYANTLNAFISSAAAVSMLKMAQYHSYSSFKAKGVERMNKLKLSIDNEYETDWVHTSLQIRTMLWLAKLHCWHIIWMVCRLR